MKDTNLKAPKVRSGEEINPVLGTIIKISVLVVIAALVVLTTLIILEFVKRKDVYENEFEDKIHINENDFEIITKGLNHDDLSDEIKEIMALVDEDMDVYFFFYYSNLLKDVDEEIKDLILSRDDENPLFLIDLNINESDLEDDEGNTIKSIIDYLYEDDYLINDVEIETLLERTTDGKPHYEYFLLEFNEEKLNNNDNPYVRLTNDSPIIKALNNLTIKEEEE